MAAVLTASTLLAAACSGDDGPEAGGDGVTLRFAWWGSEDRSAMTEEAIAAFEGNHPDAVIADPQIFADAGVEMPDDTTWTWGDYVSIAAEISAATAADVYGVQDYGGNKAGFKIFARQHGEGLYNDAGELGFSPETLAQWWDYSLQLRDSGAASQASLSAEVQDITAPEQTPLGTDRAAIMWGWTNALEALSTASGRDLVLLRPPGESENERTGTYLEPAQHYSISADTAFPEEAAVFLGFMLDDAAAVDVIGSDRGLPVNVEQRADQRRAERVPASGGRVPNRHRRRGGRLPTGAAGGSRRGRGDHQTAQHRSALRPDDAGRGSAAVRQRRRGGNRMIRCPSPSPVRSKDAEHQ